MLIVNIFGKTQAFCGGAQEQMSKDRCLGFCTVLGSQGSDLILFSRLVYLSKYMNNIGLLDWVMLDSGNAYKGFQNTDYAWLKRCK